MANVKISDTTGDGWTGLANDYESMATATAASTYGAILAAADALRPWGSATAILDNGCGPAPLTKRLLRDYGAQLRQPCTILCSDFAPGMIAAAEENKRQGGAAWERVSTVVQDCLNLKQVGDGAMSHVLAGFVYFMTPDPQKCLEESLRVLQADGALVASSWAWTQWLDVMLLVKEVRPEKTMPALPKAWTSVEGVKGEFAAAGFRDVGAREVEAAMRYETIEALVDLFVEKMPHVEAMTADMSREEMGRLRALMGEQAVKMSEGEGHPGVLKGVSIVEWGGK